MGKDEKPVTSDDIGIDVSDYKVGAVPDILRKHGSSWYRHIGDINVTEIGIKLKPDFIPF